MHLTIPFDNSYATLPDRFYVKMAPTPVKAPKLIAANDALSRLLGIDPEALRSEDGIAAIAGNLVPEGADPLAQAYAGHQFGGWSPQLGDGRAILLGEVIGTDGLRRDIQLKGSGPTPFSRMGDGRAWLGPVLREYLVSEAMHALGIPTTRALAAVTTGDIVVREEPLPGAVLARVAQSHIRVGTFQFFAARKDIEGLQTLTDHVIARHYPGADGPVGLLKGVIARQAKLVAQWMGVGFIHGVMNTDNTQIAGETIDYGPCAFMDGYHPEMVYSSIDTGGRYAYGRQPDVLVWNLAQLATALLPLMSDDSEAAIAEATEVVHSFPDLFRAAWLDVFAAKIGISNPRPEDTGLIHALLDLMTASQSDFTNTFRALPSDTARDHFADRDAFDAWAETWRARLAEEPTDWDAQMVLMHHTNPAFIPRNHRIEAAIQAAKLGDYAPFERLGQVLARPFDEHPEAADLMRPPAQEEIVSRTFCGT